VQIDPLLYGTVLSGTAGPFTSVNGYRLYDVGSNTARAYTSNARTYTLTAGAANEVRLTGGTASSRRVKLTVAGPMTQGTWWVENATTGERVRVTSGLGAGQTLVFDAATDTATQDGGDVTYAMLGTIPSLAPGENVYRLSTPDPNATGTLTVTAYAADR
jgi:hypothetical protein